MDREQLLEASKVLADKMIKEKKSLQELLNIQDSTLEQIYFYAFARYNSGKYNDALHLFDFLVKVAPKSYKFAYGFSSCLFQLKDYKNALFWFSLSHSLENTLPQPAYFISHCLMQLGDNKQALKTLDLTIELAGKKEEFSALREKCKLLKIKLENN